ncbi:hypothetical protein EDB92DRAFT_1949474 [Lactarius akahatsu]|uniref:Uncharacterized protein n=1 Tax=Lactarius akahatsu TaxID=416441 RepID=A0AAD4LBT4_9AGAM|nr:hypothetical protein EDB92DRAFT_1949474 [Lactarius akahatsu]
MASVQLASPSVDLSCPKKGMYRLLDLITEHGSGDPVDKIVIAQESLQAFIKAPSPGAYSSITKINFKTLDDFSLKPIGMSKRASILQCIANCFVRARGAEPILRSWLYIIRTFSSTAEERTYVLYWPEDTTWDDDAISTVQCNRAMFMRYLTKLCDQLVCLLSTEHSQAIVWGDEVDDMDGASLHSENIDSDRLYDFMVAKANEQEENVIARQGFTMNSSRLVNQPPPPNMHIDPSILSPNYFMGKQRRSASQILLPFEDDVVLCISENLQDKALKTLMRLGLSTWFPEDIYIDDFRTKKVHQYASDSYFINGRKEYLQNQEVEYKIHILRLLADQKHNLQLDPSYVPVPVLNERLSQSFHVPSETVVKYAHLLEGDRILLGLIDSQGNVMIMLDRLSRIDATIKSSSLTLSASFPTGNELKSIVVSAQPFPSFTRQFLSSSDWLVSLVIAGEWLADLLFLIPIRIAANHEHRFVLTQQAQ